MAQGDWWKQARSEHAALLKRIMLSIIYTSLPKYSWLSTWRAKMAMGHNLIWYILGSNLVPGNPVSSVLCTVLYNHSLHQITGWLLHHFVFTSVEATMLHGCTSWRWNQSHVAVLFTPHTLYLPIFGSTQAPVPMCITNTMVTTPGPSQH